MFKGSRYLFQPIILDIHASFWGVYSTKSLLFFTKIQFFGVLRVDDLVFWWYLFHGGDLWLKILSALKINVLWNTIISIYMFKLFFGSNAFQV